MRVYIIGIFTGNDVIISGGAGRAFLLKKDAENELARRKTCSGIFPGNYKIVDLELEVINE